MGLHTFKGGVHPVEGKDLSKDKPIKELLPKGELAYLVSQHIGAPAKPVVSAGDTVLRGQLLAEAGGFVSAPIFSSVSGTVKKIEKRRTATGDMMDAIIVDNDGEYKEVEFDEVEDYTVLSNEEILQKVKDAGLTMLYHNHFHEWRVRNGKYLMDMFYDATDPELVSFEYDTFWAARGGVDPLAYLKKMGKRVKIIHLKDMAATANPVNLVPLTEGMSNFLSFVLNDMDKSDFVEVGCGALDMKGLVKEGIDLGVDAIIVEQDNTKLEPLESVRVSMKNLKAILASL